MARFCVPRVHCLVRAEALLPMGSALGALCVRKLLEMESWVAVVDFKMAESGDGGGSSRGDGGGGGGAASMLKKEVVLEWSVGAPHDGRCTMRMRFC